MEENPLDIFGQLFGNLKTPPQPQNVQTPRRTEVAGHYCNKCEEDLKSFEVIVGLGKTRNLYYCKNNRCEKFGLVTVVAKVSKFV